MNAETKVDSAPETAAPTPEGPLSVVEAQDAILSLLDSQEEKPEQAEEEAPIDETESEPIEEEEVEVDEAGYEDLEEEEYEPDTDNVEVEGEDVIDTYSVTVNGENVDVTLEELQAGYSRQSDYTKKTQEIADERKGLEQYQTQFNEQYTLLTQERQQYQQALSQLGHQLSEGINRFATVDWARLKVEDPIAYITQRDELREEKERLQLVQQNHQRITQQQQSEMAQAKRSNMSMETKKLTELIPDWGDPTKQPKLAGEIKEYGSSQGYTKEELDGIADSRSIHVLLKAMKYDALQKADLKSKKLKNKPKLVKPGTKRSKIDAAKRRKAKSMKQLQQSGSVKDAGALLEDIL